MPTYAGSWSDVILRRIVTLQLKVVSTNIGNMELWARGWKNIFFSELTVSFKPQGKFFNSTYFEYPWAKSAMTYYRLYLQHISQHYKKT